ncbi:MAG: 3-deoxy-manno-octulosonate cytidylyltransferase [Victivallales bacterium]|jgi:3-deoxy-manno-octulosonate cytidylyltransferase (CMP-KDO synthetase)
MKAVAIIPARYASTRFPGKVLAELEGKPIIRWVYEKASASIADEVYVATDDEKVFAAVESFGGKAVMTSSAHPSGTDRIREAAGKMCPDAEIIVNVQGDEPLLPTLVIDSLISRMKSDQSLEMATVAVPSPRSEIEGNPNIVKAVVDKGNFALYFSRAPVPFLRAGGEDMPLYRHWGIYAYRRSTLEKFVSLPESALEKCEKLEQLRALENGIRIYVVVSDCESIGVDTPEDLETVKKFLKTRGKI